jgi:hypothetical protein
VKLKPKDCFKNIIYRKQGNLVRRTRNCQVDGPINQAGKKHLWNAGFSYFIIYRKKYNFPRLAQGYTKVKLMLDLQLHCTADGKCVFKSKPHTAYLPIKVISCIFVICEERHRAFQIGELACLNWGKAAVSESTAKQDLWWFRTYWRIWVQ